MKCNFVNNLKKLRIERGIYQKDLADILKVTKSTISGWETGRNQPSYETLMDLAFFFNVSIDELLGYNVNNNFINVSNSFNNNTNTNIKF